MTPTPTFRLAAADENPGAAQQYGILAMPAPGVFRDGAVAPSGLVLAEADQGPGAESAGWWRPGDGLCVTAERPVAIHTEPAPGSHHDERRLHRADGLAIAFGDGYGIHVLHGAPVP